MRVIACVVWFVLLLSTVSAGPAPEFSKPLDTRKVAATDHFERHVEELRAVQPHTDYYLELRLEIEAMRRDNPEYRDFLDRYLNRLMHTAR